MMDATAVPVNRAVPTSLNVRGLRLLPSLTDLAFLLPAVLLFFKMAGAKSLLADGDTGWHIRTGEWILAHRAVPKWDFFSFTMPHHPWFAWEWGWDALFALIYRGFGLAGVVFANVLLLCVVSALLFRLIRRCCKNDVLAMLCTAAAICASSIHWLARPHLFSWVFTLIFAHVILSADKGSVRGLKWLPALTIVWTNLHGGFFIGIILLSTAALGEAAAAVLGSDASSCALVWAKSRRYLFCALACLAATFVNPYTWHLHQHIVSYLRDSTLLDHIQEFQSINFRDAQSIFFEGMLLLGAASALWCFKIGKFGACFSLLLWAHLALVSARNIPIFAFVAAPYVACMLQDLPRHLKPAARLRGFAAQVSEICGEFCALERVPRIHVFSAVAVVAVALLFTTRTPQFQAQFDSDKFPARAIPILAETGSSHVFTYDQWGDYLIYRMYPAQQVFFDGRSDFYGHDFADRYLNVLNAGYGWERDLQRFAVDTVLVKPDAPVATVLKTSPHWKLLFDNGSFLIFRARSGVPTRASNQPVRFSPVSHNGGNELGAANGFEVDGSNSKLTSHERRSL